MAKLSVKKKRRDATIPQASTSDIAFLLLLFFMVTTVFVQEKSSGWNENDGPLQKVLNVFLVIILQHNLCNAG